MEYLIIFAKVSLYEKGTTKNLNVIVIGIRIDPNLRWKIYEILAGIFPIIVQWKKKHQFKNRQTYYIKMSSLFYGNGFT